MNNTIFSVVDIETTGSNQSEDKNRIIQFSCTFVQNQEIIGSFNSFINPMIEIPNDITKLTGISNETVAQAPTFAEIADKIYQLLQHTVFVAHNVNFDFSFLNLEFKRNQHKILKNKAIDTVTLSQLLFPTESSYKLTDLSKRFNIIHQHPHSSSSDALATAKILILLLKRINNLPQYIIKQILQVNPTLPKDSLMVFKTADFLTSSNQKNPDLILNSHLLIRKVKYQQTPQMFSLKYSTNRTQKQKKFLGLKNINVNENRLMNLIYQNYSKQGGRNLVIEENNYFDADLSYLLPLYYRASIDRPIIIAVAGKEQQTHIQQILTLINHNMNSPKKALILDDVQNYIDLTKFADSLKIISSSKYTQFLKCKILIWLTMTKTGNLNELKLRSNNSQNEFINIISSAHNDGFYIKKLNYDINNTAIIITSHTYLLQNAIQLSTKKPYLVIKNAKQLPLAALKDKRVKLFLNNNHIITNHIIGMLHQTHNKNIYKIFQNSTSPRFMVKKLENVIIQISEYINEFNQALQNSLYNKQKLVEDDKGYHMRISNHALKQVIHKYDKLFNLIARKQQIVLDINHALKQHLHHFSSAQKAILYTFFDKIDEYNLFLNQQIFKLRLLCQGETENQFFIWQVNADKDIKNAVLTGGMIFNKQLLQEQVYQYFNNFIIMDHAIYSSKRSQFFYETLELKRKKTRMIKLLPSTAQKKHSNNNFQFITTPADTDISIVELMKHNIRGNTFIWTASQKRTLELEAQLKNSAIDDASVILSQDVNNNKKIVKKMNNSRQNIMIGNQKLLQAIQQRKKSIQILIIDSLAITNFDNLYLQANYELKQKQLGNARARFSIPLAILEIRQAIENIILLSNQNGIVYMQDQTLISDTYRQNIAELLSLTLITMSKEQLIAAFDRLDNEKRGD